MGDGMDKHGRMLGLIIIISFVLTAVGSESLFSLDHRPSFNGFALIFIGVLSGFLAFTRLLYKQYELDLRSTIMILGYLLVGTVVLIFYGFVLWG
jgi:hypothetical protein